VWDWLFFVCCAHASQALPPWSELTNNTLWNQTWRTFLYLSFECRHRYNNPNVIKTIQNGVFVFLIKKEQKPVSSKKNNKNHCFFSKTKKNRLVVLFEEKRVYLNPAWHRPKVLYRNTVTWRPVTGGLHTVLPRHSPKLFIWNAVVCFLEVDKTFVDIFGILSRFIKICWGVNICSILLQWFFYI